MGRGVGVGVGVDVGVGVGVLVSVGVAVGVGADRIPLQPDKDNPINVKKLTRNNSFLSIVILSDLETRLVLL
jgi:hypothetical protein